MNCQGISEKRALRVIGMSPSAYRYQPAADHNCALRHKIIALAQRHRRYGAGASGDQVSEPVSNPAHLRLNPTDRRRQSLVVASQLGHEDVEIVFRTYDKIIREDFQKPKPTLQSAK